MSISSKVCSFALPRAPSATETFAIVAASGASTILRKSYAPIIDHWCSTFAPSSSTSRFTSLRRSGFAWSVCTPFAVSVVSITYVGIARLLGSEDASLLPGASNGMTSRRRGAMGEREARTQGVPIAALLARLRTPHRAVQRSPAARAHALGALSLSAGSLVEVQDRRADEQQRRENDVGESRSHPLRRLTAGAEQEREHQPREVEDDHKRREPARRVHVIGSGEPERPPERPTEAEALDHRRGHHPADERQVRDRRQQEQLGEERRREEDEHAGSVPGQKTPAAGPYAGDAHDRRDVGQGQQQCPEQNRRLDADAEHRRRVAERDSELGEGRHGQAEREHVEEVTPVEADRLRNQLPDRALLRRERRRQRLPGARLLATLLRHQMRRLVAKKWIR